MNAKLLLCIAMGVFVAHLAVFMIIARWRMDRLPPPPPVTEPNFSVAEAVEVDSVTGEKTVHREIRVTTKLADPRDPDARRRAP